jgi:3-oxoacyl-[acyl-carrier-protein] synthase II
MKKRVVITGLGLITPIGIGKVNFWDALIKGVSGIKPIRHFDTSVYSTNLGGEVHDFSPEDYASQSEIASLDRAALLSVASAQLAMEDADLDPGRYDCYRSGVIMGTTTATHCSFADYHSRWFNHGEDQIEESDIKKYTNETLYQCISVRYGLKGLSMLVLPACAAGTYSIGYAFDLLRNGQADFMLAGGCDAMSEVAFCGFDKTRSLAKDACRPFDANRKGLVVSEGACTVVLETDENAIKRGAHIYCEILGYGNSCDANHATAIDEQGAGPALAMTNALQDATLSPESIDYINAHGTGTLKNDKLETLAIKNVFNSLAYDIPVSSIKSMIGHSFGASGAIEAAASAMTLENDTIPPTINYETPDPDCDLFYVPNHSLKKEVNIVMSNSYAFGGNNASLILAKYTRGNR